MTFSGFFSVFLCAVSLQNLSLQAQKELDDKILLHEVFFREFLSVDFVKLVSTSFPLFDNLLKFTKKGHTNDMDESSNLNIFAENLVYCCQPCYQVGFHFIIKAFHQPKTFCTVDYFAQFSKQKALRRRIVSILQKIIHCARAGNQAKGPRIQGSKFFSKKVPN